MKTGIFIPICCVCNLVRNDKQHEEDTEQWGTLTAYMQTHQLSTGEYHLTHTYCPSCSQQFTKRNHKAVPDPLPKPQRSSEVNVTAVILDELAGLEDCDLDTLVRACPTLTWNQVFSEVDRLTRTGHLHMSYLGHGRYTVKLANTHEAALVAKP